MDKRRFYTNSTFCCDRIDEVQVRFIQIPSSAEKDGVKNSYMETEKMNKRGKS